ncbi:arylamine N-acetyltransferase family protein [Aureivirga marina]|uniref:arylamine N-acetyltransferase family protein n=1 Tax=Aureivirga marina TaxID=1182451 RepID=UPI0018C9DA5B|nr:arylamine N-acetyltransferase [Aureivirga marina]
MNNFRFDKKSYLERVQYKGEVSLDLPFLKAIHYAHFHTFPFENLDICLGKKVDLKPENIFEKLVKNRRGGYCFELNGLFLMALKSFGFEARALLGRVHLEETITGRGHQVTLVTINKRQWIVDTGFGSRNPSFPIPLICDEVFGEKNAFYRLKKDKYFGFLLQKKNSENEWEVLYSFDLEYVFSGDIAYGNHYTSTCEDSFFTYSRIAALPVKNGMITLFNNRLKKKINGKEEEIILENNDSLFEVLKTEFGIEINAKYKDLKPFKE